MDYLMVSVKEMKQILKGTGWNAQKILKSTGSIYIAVIQKE
jgi:hypothetical protein